MRSWIIITLIIILGSIGCDNSHSKRTPVRTKPYLTRLQEFETNLKYRGPSPQEWIDEKLPQNTKLVHYYSDRLRLKAWLYIPPNKKEKNPALIYLHGGFAFGLSDLMDCEPFINAGYVVMCPMFRGENGNPGNFELMLGEVEDAKAAIQWLANQPYIDRNRIFSFGHSAGGGISALLSLRTNVPVQHTGSCGGLYNQDVFYGWYDFVPFDLFNSNERKLRVLTGNISEMQFPHYAYIGNMDAIKDEIKSAKRELFTVEEPKLKIFMVEGDHYTSLRHALERYLLLIDSE